MTPALRARFDRLFEDALEALPPRFRDVIEEVPVIVVDRPDRHLTQQLRRDGLLGEPGDAPAGDDDADEGPLGLHSGVAITEASVEDSGHLPGQIHVFREAIVDQAGGWDQAQADELVYEEVRTTLLHEIGHHFGLDEDDLEELGYG